MLFIESNRAVPDETAKTVWSVTARVYLDAHAVGGNLRLEASINGKKVISGDPINLKRFGRSTYFDLSLQVSVIWN